MQITDVKFRLMTNESRLRALVSVTLDNELAVHDIKIIAGDDKLFLAMPSRKLTDGTYRDIVHPIGSEMRKTMEKTVIEKYLQNLKEES